MRFVRHYLYCLIVLLAGMAWARAYDVAVAPDNVPGPGQSGTQLTWEQCVRLATLHNPSLEASRQGQTTPGASVPR